MMHPFVRHSIFFRYGLNYIFIYNFGTFLRYLTDILYNAIPQDCSSRTLSYDMFMTLLFYDGT